MTDGRIVHNNPLSRNKRMHPECSWGAQASSTVCDHTTQKGIRTRLEAHIRIEEVAPAKTWNTTDHRRR